MRKFLGCRELGSWNHLPAARQEDEEIGGRKRGQNWSGFIGSAGHKGSFILTLHYASQDLCKLQVKDDCSADADSLSLFLIFLLPPLSLCVFLYLSGWMSLILRWLETKARFPHWGAFFILSDLRNKNQASPPHPPLNLPHLSIPFGLCFFFTSPPSCPCSLLLSPHSAPLRRHPIDCLNASGHLWEASKNWKVLTVKDMLIHSVLARCSYTQYQPSWGIWGRFFWKSYLLKKYWIAHSWRTNSSSFHSLCSH